jgi:hypothetical protein
MSSLDRDRYSQVKALLELSKVIDTKVINAAEGIAYSIEDQDHRNLALCEIAKYLASAGEWDKAVDLMRTLPISYEKADTYRWIAKKLVAANEIGKAQELIDETNTIAQEFDILPDKAADLNQLARLLFSANEREQAQRLRTEAIAVARLGEASENQQHSLDSSSVLWEIAEDLALLEEWSEAQDVAGAIKSLEKRNHAIIGLERIRSGLGGSFNNMTYS